MKYDMGFRLADNHGNRIQRFLFADRVWESCTPASKGNYQLRTGGDVGMSETIITLIILSSAAVACIIGLIIITVKEKKMKEKPTYYSAVGNWLSGKRR